MFLFKQYKLQNKYDKALQKYNNTKENATLYKQIFVIPVKYGLSKILTRLWSIPISHM
jgi:hypothetical protein